MKKSEIKVGGLYQSKVNGQIVTVRVDAIDYIGDGFRVGGHGRRGRGNTLAYRITNLATGRKLTFKSAAKFKCEMPRQVIELDPADVAVAERNAREQEALELSQSDNEFAGESPPEAVDALIAQHDKDERWVEVKDDEEFDEDKFEYKDDGDYTDRSTDPNYPYASTHKRLKQEGKQCSGCGGEGVAYPEAGEHCEICDGTGIEYIDGIDSEFCEQCARGKCHIHVLEDDQRSDPIESKAAVTTPVAPPVTEKESIHPVGIASKLAAARQGRPIGTPVAGMVPNPEQELILEAARQQGLKALVIAAGAGTGKTATLKMLEQTLVGRGQYTAFNRSLVDEARSKFKKANCKTTHQLAFHTVGKTYQHRLNGERVRSKEVARKLGIEAMRLELDWKLNSEGGPSVKMLSAEFLAGQVMVMIRQFCQSADKEITVKHFKYIDGIDESRQDHTNNNRVRSYLLPFARKMWEDISRVDGELPFNHDCYVKLWQLGEGDDRPIIAADYILLDEAQDTAPVFLDIIRRQEHALLIMVGDDNQQIYEWRGAVNAMAAFPGAPRRNLCQSYRFGQAIADVANTILATLDEPTDLVMRGNPSLPSRVDTVDSPHCYLYRTNAGAISQLMSQIERERKPHLIGGGADVVAWMEAAIDLQARRGTRHPELCCFETWQEVVEYSMTDEGSDLQLYVKLVKSFTAEAIRDALENMPKEEEADVIISTAHKSKGREWDTVRLGHDFPTCNRMNDADRRLLYVAATRAKLTLDVSECPPFCGGECESWGEGGAESRFAPGLKINYTQPMPTQEEQDEYLKAKEVPVVVSAPPAARPTFNGHGKFTWTKHGGNWCARGPANVTIGTRVKVERRDGSSQEHTIKSVVYKYQDAWIYGI